MKSSKVFPAKSGGGRISVSEHRDAPAHHLRQLGIRRRLSVADASLVSAEA